MGGVILLEAFLLGISSSTYCFSSCAPAVVPIFVDPELNRKRALQNLGLFLMSKLVGYLIFGLVIGISGAYVMGYIDPFFQKKVDALVAIAIGFLLLFFNNSFCVFKFFRSRQLNPVLIGLLTGLSFCPPFFSAAARVFGLGGSATGLIYFFFLFLGTTVIFLPLGGFFIFNGFKRGLIHIGRYIRIIIGFYYILILGVLGWM
ncbi:MAG: sulfite exporter TauE/SafE family protein [Spirochaetales bacterium]|nr:sulfite exporter TauE/SafE family protein [Spirochaetales bacterium]